MADNTGRDREEELFDIIRSPHRLDDLNEADDGSQYLNNTGEGDEKIFDLDDRADEVMNYDSDYDDTNNVYDDTENADLQITKTTDEVYQASGDHHMFFYFKYMNESIFLLSALRIEQICFYRQQDKARPGQIVEGWCKVPHRIHQT